MGRLPAISRDKHERTPSHRKAGNPTSAVVAAAIATLIMGAALASSCSSAKEERAREPFDSGLPDKPRAVTEEALRDAALQCIESGFESVEPTVRVKAFGKAAETSFTDAGPALLGRVEKEPDRLALGHLVVALGKLGTAQARALVQELYDEIEPPLKPWFAEALLRLGLPRARAWLLELSGASDLHVASKASLALAELSEPGDEQATRALAALYNRQEELQDSHPEAPYIVLTELARLGHQASRERLYTLLDQGPEYRQVVVAEGLARIGDESGKALLRAVLGNEGSEHRVRAAAALLEIGDYSGFSALMAALEDSANARRERAAHALGLIGSRDSLAALAALQEKETDKAVRLSACASVVLIVGLDPKVLVRASVDWAQGAFESRDPVMRDAAARLIGDLPDEEALPLLTVASVDPEPRVRKSAARSAARLKDKAKAARAVGAALARETRTDVKEAQIKALAEIANPAGTESLAKIANDRDRVGVLATGALIAVGEKAALKELESAYRNREPSLRLAAMEGAILASDEIVVPILQKGVKDRVFDIRFTAAEGLAAYRSAVARVTAVLEEGLGKQANIAARARAALLRLGAAFAAARPVGEMLASRALSERRAALPIIAAMEWDEASPFLRQAVLDMNLEVRREATDMIRRFVANNKEGTRRLYRSLANNDDELTRFKAKAQLARLTPARPAKVDLDKPGAPNTKPVEEAQKASEAAVKAFVEAKKELAALLKETEARVAKRASDEESFEQTKAYQKRIQQSHDRVVAAQREVASTARNVEQAAQPLVSLAEVKRAVDKARERRLESANEVATLGADIEELQAKVEKWVEAETASVQFYCETAETAIPAGRLSEARRNLRAAEQLSKREPCVLFARALLYDEVAANTTKSRKRIRSLKKARKSYEKFLSVGSGYRVEQANERIAAIDQELSAP